MTKSLRNQGASNVYAFYSECGLKPADFGTDYVCCATDIVGVSVTLLNVTAVVDFQSEFKPKGSLIEADSGFSYVRTLDARTPDVNTQKQRKGRTGRNVAGSYYNIGQIPTKGEGPWPDSTAIEFALQVLSEDPSIHV